MRREMLLFSLFSTFFRLGRACRELAGWLVSRGKVCVCVRVYVCVCAVSCVGEAIVCLFASGWKEGWMCVCKEVQEDKKGQITASFNIAARLYFLS